MAKKKTSSAAAAPKKSAKSKKKTAKKGGKKKAAKKKTAKKGGKKKAAKTAAPTPGKGKKKGKKGKKKPKKPVSERRREGRVPPTSVAGCVLAADRPGEACGPGIPTRARAAALLGRKGGKAKRNMPSANPYGGVSLRGYSRNPGGSMRPNPERVARAERRIKNPHAY